MSAANSVNIDRTRDSAILAGARVERAQIPEIVAVGADNGLA